MDGLQRGNSGELSSPPERFRPKLDSLYLSRCQVDTPDTLVAATWTHVSGMRSSTIEKVVDFGAGNGRFARYGDYQEYVGYEIDEDRVRGAQLPENAKIIKQCAFESDIDDADVCIGNPPFVRNQDLPTNWRTRAAEKLLAKTGVEISGLANAWQYFFLLSLASTKLDSLCALVIPYEWVSRPSVKKLRDFIHKNEWNVSVYRLIDTWDRPSPDVYVQIVMVITMRKRRVVRADPARGTMEGDGAEAGSRQRSP
jgi:hypothetical protein